VGHDARRAAAVPVLTFTFLMNGHGGDDQQNAAPLSLRL
jgi:hypothetical protein